VYLMPHCAVDPNTDLMDIIGTKKGNLDVQVWDIESVQENYLLPVPAISGQTDTTIKSML